MKHLKIIFCSLGILFLSVNSAPLAFSETNAYDLDAQKSRMEFHVGATLHPVHGRIHQATSHTLYDPVTGQTALPVRIEIPVSALETGDDARDREMRSMFQSDRFPVIVWTATSMKCGAVSSGSEGLCEAEGVLQIREIKHPVSFQARVKGSENEIHASGKAKILLDDYDLHPPTFLGVFRVGKEVSFDFETIWRSSQRT